MAVTLFMRIPELSPGRYDRMIAELELDASPPPGLILHVARKVSARSTCSRSGRRGRRRSASSKAGSGDALRRYGVEQPLAYRLEPLHNLFVPDDDMIALIGAHLAAERRPSRVRAS